jgi:hypothetical protein
LRFSLEQAVFTRAPGPAQKFVTVAASTATTSSLYLVIDGSRDRMLTSNGMRLPIPAGSHYVSLQSADGTLGSPETQIIDGTPNAITLPLWPIVHIRGTIRLPRESVPLGTELPSPGGITVVLQPGAIVAQTDESGAFDFPAQALDPNSTITVDESTLPSGFAGPAAQKLPGDGNVTIILKPSKKVQKIIF